MMQLGTLAERFRGLVVVLAGLAVCACVWRARPYARLAEKWRMAHYLPDWKQKTPQEKERLGMRPTKDLVARAKLCAECHVGTAEREVNHDLIAAGHPRLNFEFAAYLANMPAHWREEGENARLDFGARACAVGQLVSAQAA